MKNKISVILAIIILLMSCINGFAQDSQSNEQEKIDQLIKKFWSISYGEWGSVSEAFREIGDQIIEPLIKMLRNSETSEWSQYRIEWHQRRIAWALGQVRTERAIELLIEIVQDRTLHDYGRYEAARSLRRIKSEKAVEPLIKVLNDKKSNPPPRFGAAYALGDIQSEKAVPSLIKALSEENVQMRMGAVYGLGHIGSNEAVEGLMKALKDRDGYIRRLTYPYLIELLPEKKIEFLIMALKEEDWGAREDSVKALVEIGEPMFEHLIPLLKDDDTVVRWEASRILGMIQLERAVGV
jgi:HEAT repeat protein